MAKHKLTTLSWPSIRMKLFAGFLTIILIILLIGYFFIIQSQEALKMSIGENSILLATEGAGVIDRTIYHRIEELQVYSKDLEIQKFIKESNEEFEKLEYLQAYIDRKDEEWVSVPEETITPFMQEIMNNELSKDLVEKMRFYEEKYGYRLYGEFFATNKYGANAAQTGKTSDYYQADEEWWQNAKEEGFYVGYVSYDESADIYSVDIITRVDDEDRYFIGVIKGVLNLRGIIDIIEEIQSPETNKIHTNMEVKLINREGKIIYTTEGGLEFFESVSDELLSHFFEEGKQKDYFVVKGDPPSGGNKLFSYAHCSGYKDYKGLGWVLIIEYETEHMFAPMIRLRTTLLVTIVITTTIALLFSIFISRSISNPITELRDAVIKIGGGKLETKIKVTSKDEIGELASAFNKMTEDLRKSQEKLQSYSKDLEKQVKKRTRQLDIKIKESEETRLATLNMLEDVEETRKKLSKTYKELKSLDKLKAEFMNIAAHELKTPLIPILGYLDMLLKEDLGRLNEKQKQSLNTVLKNTKRLQRLVEDIIDITKLESKIMKFEMKNIQMASIVKDSVENMKPFAEEKKLVLTSKIPSKLPLIYGDSMRLTQVLGNLIDNAIKFTNEGSITVEAKRGRNNIIVSVKDTGIGIDKKFMPKLFTKFQQADTSAKRKYGGTGLGLVICKEIVEVHKGKIWAESTPGKGTTFSFTLPIKRVKERHTKKV